MLPGLSEKRISQLTAGLPFALPRSVVDLYKWSEGLRPRSGMGKEFFPGMMALGSRVTQPGVVLGFLLGA